MVFGYYEDEAPTAIEYGLPHEMRRRKATAAYRAHICQMVITRGSESWEKVQRIACCV